MHRKAEGKAVVDYSFHVILSDLNESTLREMPVMIDRGYTSFKMFTTYEALRVTDDVLLKALVQARTHGGLVYVHAENHHMIDYLVKEFQAAGKIKPKYHALSCPPLAEGLPWSVMAPCTWAPATMLC